MNVFAQDVMNTNANSFKLAVTIVNQLKTIIYMAVDLRCPNCQDNLGKDVENDKIAHCGNCGEYCHNERGEDNDLSVSQEEWLKANPVRKKVGRYGFL